MSDQKPPQPPTGPGDEQQTSGSGYPPPSGSGSVYESSAYQQPQPETPHDQPSPPATGSPAGPPTVGSAPPGYENAYPPAAYPQQGPYAAPGPPRDNTQLFGILGIIFAVVCCPLLGVLFGWLAMNEAKKSGADDTLGKVGFWLGIAFTAVYVVAAVIAICAGGLSGWNNRF